MSAPGFQFTRYHGTDKKCKIISLFQGYLSPVFLKTILQFNHSPVLLRTTIFLTFLSWKRDRALSSPVTMELTIEARRHK